MKRINITFWVFNILFAGLMLFSSIPDFTCDPEAVAFMAKLGYPKYLLPFLGVAKTLGVIVILIPGLPKLKEWAYAGLCFDLLGATYSIIAVGTPFMEYMPMLLMLILPVGAYLSYVERQKARQAK